MSDVQTIGFIGAGRIGTALARRALAAGQRVVLSNSRGPETLADLVADLRAGAGGSADVARAGTPQEAAQAGDVVVVTIPLAALGSVPVAPLAGTTVLDTVNYYPDRDGEVPALEEHQATTSGLVQDHLQGAHVVKAFGTMHSDAIGVLARPAGAVDRSAIPVFGDDQAAVAQARAVIDAWGFDVLDAGGLEESWRVENGQPAYGRAYATGDDIEQPRPAGAADLAPLLERARRDVEPMTFVQPD